MRQTHESRDSAGLGPADASRNDDSEIIRPLTGILQWPSSSPKNNRCCATARAASSATRRRCRICGSLRDSKDATGFSRELWKAFAEMGFSGLLVPEKFGGSGLGCVEAGVVMEEIGRTLMPSPFLSTAVLAASALSRGGSDAQKSEHLPKIANGSLLAALAIDEGAKHRPLQTNAGGALRQRFQAQGRQGARGRRPHRGSPDRGGPHRAARPASATG